MTHLNSAMYHFAHSVLFFSNVKIWFIGSYYKYNELALKKLIFFCIFWLSFTPFFSETAEIYGNTKKFLER